MYRKKNSKTAGRRDPLRGSCGVGGGRPSEGGKRRVPSREFQYSTSGKLVGLQPSAIPLGWRGLQKFAPGYCVCGAKFERYNRRTAPSVF